MKNSNDLFDEFVKTYYSEKHENYAYISMLSQKSISNHLDSKVILFEVK